MSRLIFEIEAIADLAKQVAQDLVARNEQTNKIDSEQAGPVAVAAALSDFFEAAVALDDGKLYLEGPELAEFGDFGINLLDRLSYQLLVLEIMERLDDMALIFASFGVWSSRHDVMLDNLEGIANGFARLTNGVSDPRELAEMCQYMEEVADVASPDVQKDEDRGNPYRPWRVLNLNAGIAATRSLDAELMEHTFEQLGRRLPYEMPGFLADGERQMATQQVPDAVRNVIEHYVKKWADAPDTPLH